MKAKFLTITILCLGLPLVGLWAEDQTPATAASAPAQTPADTSAGNAAPAPSNPSPAPSSSTPQKHHGHGKKHCGHGKGAWIKHRAWKIADHIVRQFDTDGDGALDKMELAQMIDAHRQHWKQGSTVPKTSQLALSPSFKSIEMAKKMLAKFDADKDGKLDRKELAAMIIRHCQRMKNCKNCKYQPKGEEPGEARS